MSKINPCVPIELDKPRNLLLNLNAMAAFEEATGKNMLKAMGNLSASDFRALLWACLKQEDKELTLEQAGELIDIGNMEYLVNKLSEAWAVAVPDKKPKNG